MVGFEKHITNGQHNEKAQVYHTQYIYPPAFHFEHKCYKIKQKSF